mmetsp:Transcript_13014/g.28512  ORF Transcript_13014/g.28512 Transcript_13014/m.28512 type:complete len:233 (-) Transcript_13014:1545-2243(-)
MMTRVGRSVGFIVRAPSSARARRTCFFIRVISTVFGPFIPTNGAALPADVRRHDSLSNTRHHGLEAIASALLDRALPAGRKLLTCFGVGVDARHNEHFGNASVRIYEEENCLSENQSVAVPEQNGTDWGILVVLVTWRLVRLVFLCPLLEQLVDADAVDPCRFAGFAENGQVALAAFIDDLGMLGLHTGAGQLNPWSFFFVTLRAAGALRVAGAVFVVGAVARGGCGPSSTT